MWQGRTLSSFISQTIPSCVEKEKATHVGGILLLAPKLIGHLYPLALCKEPFGSQTQGLFSRVLHQSRILFAPHWLIGSSPPAAVAMSVWVPAKWGAQMCAWWGAGQDATGSSNSVLPPSPSAEKNFPKFALISNEGPLFGQWPLWGTQNKTG